MKAPAFSARGVTVLRRLPLVAVLALAACGNGPGTPGRSAADVSVSGNLTLKGAQPGAWWAVTDDQGHVWKITSPTPEQVATFEQAQNRRVRIEGHRQKKYLSFEQIEPSRVIVAP